MRKLQADVVSPKCDVYFCDVGANQLFFSVTDPATGDYYYNSQHQILPGIWVGQCGAPIGPDPAQLPQWTICCPGIHQLELCNYVPCSISGALQCTLATQCIPMGGTPQVFACNNNGDALKDGTCACTTNEETGVGHGPE